jgi:hypothetical protein
VALAQVSEMQERCLASEDRRRELETGIDVIQDTLRRTIKERDEARAELDRMTAGAERTGRQHRDGPHPRRAATLDYLTTALGDTARERDDHDGRVPAGAKIAALEQAEAKRDLEAAQRRDLCQAGRGGHRVDGAAGQDVPRGRADPET